MHIKKSKIVILVALFYCIIAISAYIFNITYHFLGTENEWVSFSTYLAGIVAPITAFGTIYITYLVYRLNANNNKTEQYFSKIVELYFHLVECYDNIKKSHCDNEKEQICSQKIKQFVALLRYYLNRFPDTDCPIDDFDKILNDISFEPINERNYQLLSKEFRRFCFYANGNERRSLHLEH